MSNFIEIKNLYKIFGNNEVEALTLVKKGLYLNSNSLFFFNRRKLVKKVFPKFVEVKLCKKFNGLPGPIV